MSTLQVRQQIMDLEADMAKQQQVDLPVTHNFCNGIYTRTLYIPAGVLLTGRVHKYETLSIMVSGRIKVLSDKGGAVELEGYNQLISPPGLKRIAFALEDTIWMNVFATTETDPEVIKAMFTDDDENTDAIAKARSAKWLS